MDLAHSRWRTTGIVLGVVAVSAGLFLAWRGNRAIDGGLSGGDVDGLLPKGPYQDEPADVWVTPSGRRFVSGSIDELGYVLPLDVHRRPRPRPDAEPPVDPPRRPAARRGSSNERRPAGGFEEHRLGPDMGHTQNETTIDVAGKTLIAGWNQITDSSLVMGAARSIDRGESWTWELFDGHDVMSDPAVKAGGAGRWYYVYLAAGGAGGADIEVYVRRSLDDGATWQPPVPVTNNATFDDKPYLDARGDEVLVAWADFDFAPARVRAARSLDGGQTFGNDTVLVDAPGGGNGACPVIAADGTYYVFWRGSSQEFLWMSRSVDQGANWTEQAAIVTMSPLPSTMPGGFRMINLPSAADDPFTGDLLVLWNDQAFGDPDILAIRSDDGGDTWSEPVRVNDDGGGDAQFFPWVAFDDAGIAHAAWYDRRQNGFDIDVYFASSADGGATWSPNVRVTAESFTPVLPWDTSVDFIGDYNAVAAGGGQAYPFYQDARSGIQDVYVSRVPTVSAIFTDGFESGDASAWDGSVGLP